ncbi:MAG: glycosyltransferase family 2 protein [Endozoicomonadaceae bacterium]|nr:glycosyltransferase family 2 protein [Endozoicomonadaceae bacterium]
MAPNKVAVIIPAFNEELSIGRVLKELISIIGKEILIIVVNDCSSDETSNIASANGAHVVDLARNHGYAEAINKGLAHASFKLNVEYLITMDADGQHDPHSVQLIIETMSSDNIDLIVGQRPNSARFSEWLYGFYFSKKFKIVDPLSGLKCYRKSVYQEYGCFETYDSIGTELLTWALMSGKVVKQVPISIRNREDSPRFGSAWTANKRITKSLLKTIYYVFRSA